MITAVAFYGYFIGAIAAIMQNLDANQAKYVEKMGAVTSYMKQREFPMSLRLRVKRYLSRCLSALRLQALQIAVCGTSDVATVI